MTADTTNAASDGPNPPLRLGVMRATDASRDTTVATMEARVVRVELERRLGPVTLDLRTEGPTIGPWLPSEHAAWPGDVDATIDLGDLGVNAAHLVALFGRTIEPVAADVRSRMLHHLGVLPVNAALTDELLAEVLPPPARPTDLWLVVRASTNLATSEPAHRLLRDDGGGDANVDADVDAIQGIVDDWFDRAVAALPAAITSASIARLRADLDDLRSRLAAATDELARNEREALDRFDDLATERDSLRERLDRSQLDRAGAGGSTL
jgi:hypothetical protein